MKRLAGRVIPEFYGRLAWAYDPGVWLISGGLWYRWVLAAEHLVEGQPVVDVGCGRGQLVTHLAKRGFEVIGVDSSPQMVESTRRRLRRAGLSGKVICADARSQPFPDASIGTIINTFPTAFVHDERTWAEYARVLRPGGRWITVVGPPLDRFQPRLLGLYLLLVFEHGLKAFRRSPPRRDVPQELFPKQQTALLTDGPVRVYVRIFSKK